MNLYPIESMSKMLKFYVIYSGSIYKNVGFAFLGRPSIVLLWVNLKSTRYAALATIGQSRIYWIYQPL